eukprot:scaffold184990_cov66-Cyclotella_meneghiniana.AAC.1
MGGVKVGLPVLSGGYSRNTAFELPDARWTRNTFSVSAGDPGSTPANYLSSAGCAQFEIVNSLFRALVLWNVEIWPTKLHS